MPRKVEGHGIGLRRPFYDGILATTRRVDWLEITPENWVRRGGRRARQLAAVNERYALVPHSVSLSVGGPDPLDEGFLDEMAQLCRLIDAPWYSDHLCYSSVDGVHLHDLLPLPFTREAVKHLLPRIDRVKQRLDRPLLLENATFYAVMPGSEMDEPTFIAEVLSQADCGMLLDVNNIYVNARNLGIDPQHFLRTVPLERVKQIHVAGHTVKDSVVIDTHIGPIVEDVWKLYQQVVALLPDVPVLVEWDDEIPSLDAVLDEADRARSLAPQRRP